MKGANDALATPVIPGLDMGESQPETRIYSKLYLGYVLTLFVAVYLLNIADRQLIAVAMPAIKAEFEIGDTLLGFIAGPAVTIPHILLAIPLARLADRWSRRKVLAIAVATWSFFNTVTGMTANVAQLVAARITVGIGESGGQPGITSIIAEIFPKAARSTALGIYAMAPYLGVLLGLLGGGILSEAFGWRQAFIWLGIPGVILALLCWTTLPRRGANFILSPEGSLKLVRVLLLCWERRTLRFASLGSGTFSTFALAVMTWMPSYFVRSHEMTIREAGIWIGVLSISGGVIGTLISGLLVDRFTKRDLRWQLRVPAIGLILSVPFFVAQLLLPAGFYLEIGTLRVPVVALFGFPTSLLSALYLAPYMASIVSVVAPSIRSQTVATMGLVVNLIGAMVGPFVTGASSDYFAGLYGNESLRYSLLAMTPMIVLSAFLFWKASTHYASEKIS